ncbi:MAG: type II secretion system protein [Candidatus Jorgensenbacteria bacterium]|nr:type II secretion system protein [Candidatus Jorgensenbacteria bacterium]
MKPKGFTQHLFSRVIRIARLIGFGHSRKGAGFTLIELLVVIAILATLAVAVVLVLNPAELIRQARDTTRISDLAALNSAIALYLADVSSASFTAIARCTVGVTKPPAMATACTNSTSTAVDSNGWVPINFGSISSGSPIPRLPMDPVNAASTNCDGDTVDVCMYVFASGANETYELDANMESTKYSRSGGSDVESNAKDGGDDDYWYEVGSDILTL